jgi:hypothetical protein
LSRTSGFWPRRRKADRRESTPNDHRPNGEDVEAALRFLFAGIARKTDEADPFLGIPAVFYLDNGPVAKSAVFKRVMESLGVAVTPHMPAGNDGRRTTARAKGKVERPFRTVKDAHETLYHFHQPASEEEANRWLARFIRTYNLGEHRSERHSFASSAALQIRAGARAGRTARPDLDGIPTGRPGIQPIH